VSLYINLDQLALQDALRGDVFVRVSGGSVDGGCEWGWGCKELNLRKNPWETKWAWGLSRL